MVLCKTGDLLQVAFLLVALRFRKTSPVTLVPLFQFALDLIHELEDVMSIFNCLALRNKRFHQMVGDKVNFPSQPKWLFMKKDDRINNVNRRKVRARIEQ